MEQKKTKTGSLENEALLLKSIFDNTVDGLITIDPDGLIESFNPACEKIFGYRANEVIGQNVKMLMPEPYHSKHDGYLQHYHDTGEKKIIGIGREVEGKRKDGSTFPLDLSVSEVQLDERKLFSGIVRDISERKAAEQELLDFSARLQAVMDTVVDGIITIDEKAIIQSFNPAAERILGYEANEVIGKNVKILMPDPYHTEHDGYVRHYIDTGEARVIGIGREVKAQRKDGHILPIELAINEMKVSDKRMFVGSIRDISERKEAEFQKENLIVKLGESNDELEHFAYVASHDLKEPLRNIDNLSQWIEEDLRNDNLLQGETLENIEDMRERVHRMEKLLDDLLEYSRIGRKMDSSYKEVVDLQTLLDDIITMITPPDKYKIAGTTNLAKMVVNRMPLQQVLFNLVNNAIKHHDKDHGLIQVSATNHSDDFYQLSVKDDGPGIDERYQEQVFDMFQTLRPRDEVEGSGIGLAVVRKTIRTVGGKITLQSKLGEGAEFIFTWPKAREDN